MVGRRPAAGRASGTTFTVDRAVDPLGRSTRSTVGGPERSAGGSADGRTSGLSRWTAGRIIRVDLKSSVSFCETFPVQC